MLERKSHYVLFIGIIIKVEDYCLYCDFTSVNFITSFNMHKSFTYILNLIQIPITLHKETVYDQEGREVHRCGFKIGGGIDQDYRKSPQNYSDNVSCMINTYVYIIVHFRA